jgi:uncharacterized OB-fold protein
MSVIGWLVVSAVTIFCVLDMFRNVPLYWCQWRHKSSHRIKPLEYGSVYYVDCQKCGRGFAKYRND